MAMRSVAQKSWANASDDTKLIEIRVYSPHPLRIPCGDWAEFLSIIDDKLFLDYQEWTTAVYAMNIPETADSISLYSATYKQKPAPCYLVNIYCNQSESAITHEPVGIVMDTVVNILTCNGDRVVMTVDYASSRWKERQLESRVAQLEKEMKSVKNEIANPPHSKL